MYSIEMVESRNLLAGPATGLLPCPASTTAAPAADGEGVIFARAKRVALRTLSREDLPHLSEWARSAFLEEMVGSEFLLAYRTLYRESPAFLDVLRADPSQLNLVIVAEGWDRPVGLVRLFNIHREDGYAFFETMVAEPRALRLGFGIEASKLLAYYAIDVMRLRRLEAKVYEHNLLSINTMKRRGWQLEGALRQAVRHRGRYEDLLVFGILRDEIEAQKRGDRWTAVYHPRSAA
jgi:RimJ/RimL family protein N-acetyltransferase